MSGQTSVSLRSSSIDLTVVVTVDFVQAGIRVKERLYLGSAILNTVLVQRCIQMSNDRNERWLARLVVQAIHSVVYG